MLSCIETLIFTGGENVNIDQIVNLLIEIIDKVESKKLLKNKFQGIGIVFFCLMLNCQLVNMVLQF